MTIEIMMLLTSIGLLFLLTVVQAMASIKSYNVSDLMGSRDKIPYPQPGLGGRIFRAIANLKENLMYFIPLVLLATVLNISNDNTVIGAQLFVVGRFIHAPTYILGVPWIRTIGFVMGITGCFMIAYGLLV